MRLAINGWFADNPAVGSGQYLIYLLPALLQAAPSLKIFLITPTPLTMAFPPGVEVVHRPPPFANPRSNLGKLWFEQLTFPWACLNVEAEVAHVPYFGSPLRPTCPTVVTIHDLIPMVLPEYRGSLQVRLYTKLVAAAASQAAQIMADSHASEHDIVQHLHVDGEQVRTVYLAPAPHFHQPKPDAVAAWRAKQNLPAEFILYLGGYDIRKNVPMLLTAYAQLPVDLRQRYPLVLAGKLPSTDTPFSPDPRRVARDYGLIATQIITPGWVEESEKPLLYGAATLFMYPSRYEGFGLPVLEAMACGTPVITSHVSSLPELVGEAAMLVDPTAPASIAHALNHLLSNPAPREMLAQQGPQQAAHFSWSHTAQQTLACYRRAAA